MSLTYSQLRARCMNRIDTAMALKTSLEDGFDRVVIQTALSQLYAAMRAASVPEITAAIEKLERVTKSYTPTHEAA